MESGPRSVNFSTVSEWNDRKVRRLRDSLVGEEHSKSDLGSVPLA